MKNITDFGKFSLETRIKLQMKIKNIQKYFLFYEDHKNKFNKSLDDGNTFCNMSHHAIYVLYRSMFKEIEKKQIDFMVFTENEDIIDAHKSIINLVDKDICHHDRNSKSFNVVNIDNLKASGSDAIGQNFLSDGQLKIAVEFLIKDILPRIQNTPLK